MRRHRSLSVQCASGLYFHSPRVSSRSISSVSARVGSLLAADARDPALGARQRALERARPWRPSSSARARPRLAGAAGVLNLDPHAEALLERAPGLQRLREQHAGVDRHDPHRRAVRGRGAAARRAAPTPPSGRSTAARRARRGVRRPRAACRVRLVRRVESGRVLRYVALRCAHLLALRSPSGSRLSFCSVSIYTAHSPSPRIDFERDVAVPVDERVHRLQPEVDGHREILDERLQARPCRRARRTSFHSSPSWRLAS